MDVEERMKARLMEVEGITEKDAEALMARGITTLKRALEAGEERLLLVPGIGKGKAGALLARKRRR